MRWTVKNNVRVFSVWVAPTENTLTLFSKQIGQIVSYWLHVNQCEPNSAKTAVRCVLAKLRKPNKLKSELCENPSPLGTWACITRTHRWHVIEYSRETLYFIGKHGMYWLDPFETQHWSPRVVINRGEIVLQPWYWRKSICYVFCKCICLRGGFLCVASITCNTNFMNHR